MKYIGFMLLASLAAARPTKDSKQSAKQSTQPADLITIRNAAKLCLTTIDEFIEWGPCDLALKFQAPANGLKQPSLLRTTDGKTCLSMIPYGPTKFPDLRLTPCKDGKKRDNNQLWQEYGDKQIKSMTSLGVCQGPADPFVNEGPTFVSCAIGDSGPICINNDEGYASARPCSMVYEARAVRDIVSASSPGSTVDLFTQALANGSPEGVDRYMIGQVLSQHNDVTLTFASDSTVDAMVKQCAVKCTTINCDSFDVVFDKKACYFSLSGGSDDELKQDLDAAVFFMD